jgi:hypothetical protein
MTFRPLLVVLAHDHPPSLADLVANVRRFCPASRLVLYNSGGDPELGHDLGLPTVPGARRLDYARITPFFLDIFEWLATTADPWDAVVNLETDMLFVRPGFEAFLQRRMSGCDYLAPNLVRRRPLSTRWRPMRSLRPEFERWFRFLGFRYWHGTFSPGQVFSRRYIETLLRHPEYAELKRLVAANESFTLQEVIFPTLTDFLGLRLASYPAHLAPINRYRPYQAVSGVKRALTTPDAYFVHPIRRAPDDAARIHVRKLVGRETRQAGAFT